MQTRVQTSDVLRRFVRTEEARRRVDEWTSAPARATVVPAVMAHTSSVVLNVELAEVEEVCRTTTHPLAHIDKRVVDSAQSIRDWTAPFAVTHVLHFVTERTEAIPTWDRFREACATPPFEDMLTNPAKQAIEDSVRLDRVPLEVAQQAMTWRIGLFYYSFLREQWVHAHLRHRGIPLRQHPLADALFRIDGWIGDTVLSIYLRNARFRTSTGGRKTTPREHLGHPNPDFTYVDMELTTRPAFGKVHLPPRSQVDRYLEQLKIASPSNPA